jgi:hypothetical protein
MNVWQMHWCIVLGGGDFNVVRSSCERGGEARQSQAVVDFSDFIFE